jgi:hypothetical protein
MPAWANSLQDPIWKTPNTKRAGGVAQGVGSEIKSQYYKKKRMLSFPNNLGFQIPIHVYLSTRPHPDKFHAILECYGHYST